MSKNITIYLAGAMEAYGGTNKARVWRNEAKEFFEKYCENVTIVDPVAYYSYGYNYHKTDNEIFRFDLHKVKTSDILLVNLDDIRKSVGTCMEIYEAFRSDIPVIGFVTGKYLATHELIQQIHPWVYCCVNRVETGENSMVNAMVHIKEYYIT